MKHMKTILLALGAFGAAGLLFVVGRKAYYPGQPIPAVPSSGAADLFAASKGQNAGVQQSIAASWADLAKATESQPDFWV